MIVDIETILERIWGKYKTSIPGAEYIKDGYMFVENSTQKDVLIVGMNPSFDESDKDRHSFPFHEEMKNDAPHWRAVWKMIGEENKDDTGYLDLFYFRKTKQSDAMKPLLNTKDGKDFLAAQVALTMQLMETVVNPKVIVVIDKGAWPFFGVAKDCVWMGYEFEDLTKTQLGEKCFEYGALYKIKGLQTSDERVYKIEKTQLEGSYILFSKYPNRKLNKYEKACPKKYHAETPTPALLKELLNSYEKR